MAWRCPNLSSGLSTFQLVCKLVTSRPLLMLECETVVVIKHDSHTTVIVNVAAQPFCKQLLVLNLAKLLADARVAKD